MSSAFYTPNEGSTAWKVIEFLTTNPDEFLSTSDVAAKFDVPRRTVHTHLGRACQEKVLKRTEDLATGELVYTLDQGHPAVRARPDAHPTLPRRASGATVPAPATKRKRLGFVDVSQIAVETDVPPPGPAKNTCAPKTDWPALFARLSGPGESFALPLDLRYAVAKQLGAYKKAHAASGWDYTLRVMPDGTVRVWRTA